MRHALLAAAACAALIISAGAALAATETFTATMDGKTEVPSKTTNGTGAVRATLDTNTKVLTWDATFSGLTGPATMAHFHGPAAPGANAPVVVPWQNPVSSPLHGQATLTDAQIQQLEAGQWYANVHTAANPAGEIRGQMIKQ
jgi:hypothetical protein